MRQTSFAALMTAPLVMFATIALVVIPVRRRADREKARCEHAGGQYVPTGIETRGGVATCIRPAEPLFPDHDPEVSR